MANPKWIGNAPAVAQVTAWVFGGTWEVGDIVEIAPGTSTVKLYSYAVASATITTFLDSLVTALNALSSDEYTEWSEVTWSRSGSSLIATGDTVGVPFKFTVSTRDAGGAADSQTIDSTTSSTGTDTTACSGPNFANVAANWSTGAIPVDTDDVEIAVPVSILYGLTGLSGVTPASLKINSSFWQNGATIGLPEIHGSGTTAYNEYRDRFLQFDGCTLATIGIGDTDGATLLNLDFQTGDVSVSVLRTGQSNDATRPALCLKMNPTAAADGVLEYLGGSVGVGFYGETGKCTFRATDGRNTGGKLIIGPNINTGATSVVGSGLVDIYAATTVLTQTGGTVTTLGSGAHPSVNVWAGKLYYNSSGTLGATAINIGEQGDLDLSTDMTTKTIGTTINMAKGATLRDPYGVGGSWAVKAVKCQYRDLVVVGPFDKTYTQS